MLVTALSPVIGNDKASKIAALRAGQRPHPEASRFKARGFVSEDDFDRIVDPAKIAHP
jgi:fumarate hydratase class II